MIYVPDEDPQYDKLYIAFVAVQNPESTGYSNRFKSVLRTEAEKQGLSPHIDENGDQRHAAVLGDNGVQSVLEIYR